MRHSDDGYSLISDPYGRVTAWENHVNAEGIVMQAEAPLMATPTLYPVVGDIVGQLALLGLLGLLGFAASGAIFQRLSGRRQAAPAQTALPDK